MQPPIMNKLMHDDELKVMFVGGPVRDLRALMRCRGGDARAQTTLSPVSYELWTLRVLSALPGIHFLLVTVMLDKAPTPFTSPPLCLRVLRYTVSG